MLFFTPFPAMIAGDGIASSWTGLTKLLSGLFDIGFCGAVVNTLVFVVVSRFTRPLPAEHIAAFARDADG